MTSGATTEDVSAGRVTSLRIHTPIWTSDNSIVAHTGRRGVTGNTEVCKFYRPVLVGENVGTFDVTMYHSLVVQVDQAL